MTEFSSTNQQFSNTLKIVFLILAGLILPAILIPLIKFIGYSEIVEEIAKALVVLFLILNFSTLKQKILAGLLFGLLFGASESIFYLNNIFQLSDLSVFWQRFLWTVPMHIITVLIILFSGIISRKIALQQKFLSVGFLIFGLTVAIILHILFNETITEILI